MTNMATQPGQPRIHASGMTTGQHIIHAVLTVATGGLWAPVWILLVFLGRWNQRLQAAAPRVRSSAELQRLVDAETARRKVG